MVHDADILWAVALAGLVLAIWVIFIVWVPRCLCSLFRYKLWQLRDDIKDDLLAGHLAPGDSATSLLSLVETAIIFAEKLAPIPLLLAPETEDESVGGLIKDVPPEQHERLLSYRRRFESAVLFRVFLGSVTGWFFTAMAMPALLVVTIYRMAARASVTFADVLGQVLGLLPGSSRTGDTRQVWQEQVPRKISAMREYSPSGKTKTLAECAA